MATVIMWDMRKTTGKNASRIRDMSHHLKKAKNRPETHMARDSYIEPIFSPRALVMD